MKDMFRIFFLLVTEMAILTSQSSKATVYLAKHDRDVVNSDDSLYAQVIAVIIAFARAKDRANSLYEVFAKHSAESGALTICVKYAISCEIHDTFSVQFLRDSWFAPAVDTSLFTIAVKLHLRLRGINNRDISLLQASETIRNRRITD